MELRGALVLWRKQRKRHQGSKAILPPMVKVGWEQVCEGWAVVDTIASLKDTQGSG